MDKEVKKKNVKRKVNNDKVKVSKGSVKKSSDKTSTKKTKKAEETNYDISYVMPKKKSETPIIVICLLIYFVVGIIPLIFLSRVIFMDLKGTNFEYVGNDIRVGYDEFKITNIDTEYMIDDNYYVISGYIKELDDDLDYVEIIFELYDSENVVLGETSATLFDLDDDRKYKFNATYYEYDADEVTGYRVKAIYYY